MVNDRDPAETVGGTERYIAHLSLALERAGHEVHLFALSQRGTSGAKRTAFPTDDTEPTLRHIAHVFFHPRLYAAIRRCIRRFRPDVIHLHNNYRFALTVLLALRGRRVVQTVHDYCGLYPTASCVLEPSCATGSMLAGIRHGCMNWKLAATEGWLLYNRPVIDRLFVDHVVAPSRHLRASLEDEGWRGATYLPNLIDGAVPTATDRPAAPVILYVGSLIAHKGVDVLLRAYEAVQARFPDAALWLVGSGPDEDRLKGLSGHLPNVVFRGERDAAGVAESYAQASAVVVPSLWLENAPLVAYEAMAHGRALLVADTGGLPELVVPGKTGFVFARGDAADLADKLNAMLADATKLEELGRAGAERFAELGDEAAHVARLTAIYRGSDA